MIALEESTTSAYQRAVTQFKLGTMNTKALALVIERKITPELQAMQARLKTLGRVPPEHQPLLASAEDYLRLRDESWRLRAAALHKSSMPALRRPRWPSAPRSGFERLPTEPMILQRNQRSSARRRKLSPVASGVADGDAQG
jgi:hypothetical protein